MKKILPHKIDIILGNIGYIEYITQLDKECFNDPWTIHEWKRFLSKPQYNHIMLAYINNQLVGMLAHDFITIDDSHFGVPDVIKERYSHLSNFVAGRIVNLCVSPSPRIRRRGVATELVRTYQNFVSNGTSFVVTEVPEVNLNA